MILEQPTGAELGTLTTTSVVVLNEDVFPHNETDVHSNSRMVPDPTTGWSQRQLVCAQVQTPSEMIGIVSGKGSKKR